MTTLVVPPLGDEPWPTLGPDVVRFIEDNLVYGPGELRGQSYQVEPEFKAQLYRAYEVYPKGHRLEGRRRFKRVALEVRKGTAKTEKAAIVAAVEAHPFGPVRCDGFRRVGRTGFEPVARSVRDPYIPLLAYTKDQSEDLAYFVLKTILAESRLADDFDIGEERILVRGPNGRQAGKIVALAGSPNARDGARTTFQHFDETHRLALPKLVKAHSTMLENTYKRVGADAWSLETTTAGEPGDQSVAEDTRYYAEQVAAGNVEDPRLFFFARWAPEQMPMDTPDEVRTALLEASGPAASWSGDIDALVSRWFEPKTDRPYYRRVWLNQWVVSGSRAFDPDLWDTLARKGETIPAGAQVTLGMDGSRRQDATGIVATDVVSGFQQVVFELERPHNAPDDWEIPAEDVDAAMTEAFERWDVLRCYCDPPYWDEWVDAWEGRRPDRVFRWWTNRPRPMAYSLRAYRDAQVDGSLAHDGDEMFARHIANAVRKQMAFRDENDEPLWTIRKERPDSPKKIDLAMAGCLSWEARGDAIAAGALEPVEVKQRRSWAF